MQQEDIYYKKYMKYKQKYLLLQEQMGGMGMFTKLSAKVGLKAVELAMTPYVYFASSLVNKDELFGVTSPVKIYIKPALDAFKKNGFDGLKTALTTQINKYFSDILDKNISKMDFNGYNYKSTQDVNMIKSEIETFKKSIIEQTIQLNITEPLKFPTIFISIMKIFKKLMICLLKLYIIYILKTEDIYTSFIEMLTKISNKEIRFTNITDIGKTISDFTSIKSMVGNFKETIIKSLPPNDPNTLIFKELLKAL